MVSGVLRRIRSSVAKRSRVTSPLFQFTPHLMVSRHFGLTDYPRARVRPQGSAPPQQGNRGSPPVLLRLHSGWTPPFACFRGLGGLTSGSYLVVWVALGSKITGRNAKWAASLSLRGPLCAGEAFPPQGRGGRAAPLIWRVERRGAPEGTRTSSLHPTYLHCVGYAKKGGHCFTDGAY